MTAKVSITSISIGSGESYRWRSIMITPQALKPDDSSVKIWFGVSNVRGEKETINAALSKLQEEGHIASYQIGLLGATPEVICTPGAECVREICNSRTVHNDFVTDIQARFTKLLDEIGGTA